MSDIKRIAEAGKKYPGRGELVNKPRGFGTERLDRGKRLSEARREAEKIKKMREIRHVYRPEVYKPEMEERRTRNGHKELLRMQEAFKK